MKIKAKTHTESINPASGTSSNYESCPLCTMEVPSKTYLELHLEIEHKWIRKQGKAA